uniref:Uncharacterized protein LOC114343836 n=1 Tax=Diabrotica virgifera virgifera TaxID=50390 RepID=A0A6P7GKP0_DIAVI
MTWGFVTCGPNEALVISGCCYSKPLLVPGGRAFVWPSIQKIQRISLNTMTLIVDSPTVYTSQGVPISVTGIAQVSLLFLCRLQRIVHFITILRNYSHIEKRKYVYWHSNKINILMKNIFSSRNSMERGATLFTSSRRQREIYNSEKKRGHDHSDGACPLEYRGYTTSVGGSNF